MKIRPTFRRSARRVSRRAADARFFQAEASEAPFFSPAADVQKVSAEGEDKIDKAPTEEKKEEPGVMPMAEEEEVQTKREEEVSETVAASGGNP